jgi:uncharacterized membrane protein YfcA
MGPYFWLVPVFFGIALVFSMLGMGGSQLYIPLLFWTGMDFKTEAVPLGMLLNVANSGSAAVTYARNRLVAWRTGLPFAASMVVCAPVGVLLHRGIPAKPLLVFFALFTALAATLMLSGWRPVKKPFGPRGRMLLGLSAGAALGVTAGLIGRGGGSFVVPLLYVAGLDPKRSAATSSVIVTLSGLSSFISHLSSQARPHAVVWLACVAAVLLGSQIGSRLMARKLESPAVKVVFGVVLLGVAALILVKDVLLA